MSLEERKLIESLYAKNNNYLLMTRAYEDDKTLALAKNHGFRTVVLPKNSSINNFTNNPITLNDIFSD